MSLLFLNLGEEYSLKEVQDKIIRCDKCEHHKEVYTSLAGYGPPNPKLYVLGSHPAKGEDVLGQMLIKDAGKVIRQKFYDIGLTDREIYWDCVVHCSIPESADNEVPLWQMKNCFEFLDQLVDVLKPKLIVGLGNTARIRMFYPKHMESQKKLVSSLLDAKYTMWDYRGNPMIIISNPAGLRTKYGYERQTFADELSRDMKFVARTIKELCHE